MKFLICLLTLLFAQLSAATEVAECLGTADWDGSQVTANVVSDAVGKRIIIQTHVDTVESTTAINRIGLDRWEITDNDFRMNFTVKAGEETSPVEAFRDGQFFVEDFACRLLPASDSTQSK